MFAYNNNYNLLLTAKELGIDLNNEELLKIPEYSVLKTVLEQIDRYDPVQIGLSGQIKEFREEDYYCSIGDEYHHRHISHIVGLYPGDVINSTTPAWLDAAVVSLNERGDNATGWGLAHRFNAHARTKNGDRAHKVLEAIISKRTAPNLWNLHPPFQIDGNFGLTAGISEMLVQSHEGYIAPLAALPSDWKCGSFSGLIARGNFEVSASWEDSLLKTLKINSRSGGKLSLCYPSITKTCITNEIGNKVAYTVLENDVITFDTKVGAVYTVSGFIRTVKPASPSELTYAKEDAKKIKLTWNTVDNVCHYNVYKADESASDYTLIGTASENEFIYIQQSAEDDIRTTFAVTSVSFDSVESDRTLCYKNPRVITEYGVIPAENADAPFAISAPPPMANPTSLSFNDGASFIPSPVMPTTIFSS